MPAIAQESWASRIWWKAVCVVGKTVLAKRWNNPAWLTVEENHVELSTFSSQNPLTMRLHVVYGSCRAEHRIEWWHRSKVENDSAYSSTWDQKFRTKCLARAYDRTQITRTKKLLEKIRSSVVENVRKCVLIWNRRSDHSLSATVRHVS